jgi:hypothetical protein
MWDPPNPKIMSQISSTFNPLGSDGRLKRDPIYRGPTSSHSVTKQANLAHSGRTDAVDFIVDRCSDRHAGTGFVLETSLLKYLQSVCEVPPPTGACLRVVETLFPLHQICSVCIFIAKVQLGCVVVVLQNHDAMPHPYAKTQKTNNDDVLFHSPP